MQDCTTANAVLQGEREAFGLSLTQYANKMKAISYRVLRDKHLAEDVVQASFLRAYANRSKLQEGCNLGGYLYTIAYHVSIDYQRRGKRELLSFEDTLPLQDHDTPEHIAIRQDRADHVWGAVYSVDESYRLPLLLYYQHDWPLQKIADHLRLSVPAVKSRLHRSKKVLRTKLMGM